MFTFGRDHEKRCAARNVRNPADSGLVDELIDSIHDFLEGKTDADRVRSAVFSAFALGGSGAWEQSGSWLLKLGQEYPEMETLWLELAAHPKAEVRFRVSCHLNDLSPAIAAGLQSALEQDRSSRVRQMATARRDEREGRTDF